MLFYNETLNTRTNHKGLKDVYGVHYSLLTLDFDPITGNKGWAVLRDTIPPYNKVTSVVVDSGQIKIGNDWFINWVITPAKPRVLAANLERYKIECVEKINRDKKKKLAAGFSYGGKMYATDGILGQYLLSTNTVGFTTIDWIAIDNTKTTLTATQLKDLMVSSETFIKTVTESARLVKDSILQATTYEDIKAITDNWVA